MSREALAVVYTRFLTDASFREEVAASPRVLTSWDLADDEAAALVDEARSEVMAFANENSVVVGKLVTGPPLSGPTSAGLGAALNLAAGLPTQALNGAGFLANSACCPWGHGVVGWTQDPTGGT